jgi:type I restriction enzyme S subunit
VPNLRFPEFSGEWEKVFLSKIVKRVTRKNNNNETLLPLTISAQHGLVDQTSFFNKVVASNDMSNYHLLYNGEFAYNKSYSKDYPWGAIKRLDRYDKGALSSLYICFAHTDLVESDFLVHYFESSKWYKEIYHIAGEGARNHGLLNIAVSDFFSTKHWITTNKNEQRKIADLLNLINERISTQKKIIEKYESLIRGLYHYVFNNTECEHFLLKDIVNIVKGKQVNREDLLEIGKYYVMNGGIDPSGYLNEYNTPAHTISISEGGNSCGYVQYNSESFWSGGHCYSLIPKDETTNYQYLYHFLKYKERNIMALRIGSGLPNMQKKDLERFKVILPSVEQQNRIAAFFKIMSVKNDLEKSLLQNLQCQKAYFLSSLFI